MKESIHFNPISSHLMRSYVYSLRHQEQATTVISYLSHKNLTPQYKVALINPAS